jgi:hypothetical protein
MWTASDDALVTKMFKEYAPTEEIARVLGRAHGATRLRIFKLGLHRDASYSKLAKKYPQLAPVLRERGPEEFIVAVKSWVQSEKARKALEIRQERASKAKVVAEILERQISRNEKMRALRLAGLNLAETGALFGITRERVRQIQLADFRTVNETGRKVSATRPENRNRHVDRLVAAWNRASVEARQIFLEQATADIRMDLPRLIQSKRKAPARCASTERRAAWPLPSLYRTPTLHGLSIGYLAFPSSPFLLWLW